MTLPPFDTRVSFTGVLENAPRFLPAFLMLLLVVDRSVVELKLKVLEARAKTRVKFSQSGLKGIACSADSNNCVSPSGAEYTTRTCEVAAMSHPDPENVSGAPYASCKITFFWPSHKLERTKEAINVPFQPFAKGLE